MSKKIIIKWLMLVLMMQSLLISKISWAMSKNKNNKAIERYIIIHNDLPMTIYPVLQVPDNNCHSGSTTVQRLIVNFARVNTGIPPGKTVKVLMPNRCWYNAGRLYLFSVNLKLFEDKLDSSEKTIENSSGLNNTLCADLEAQNHINPLSPSACYTGYARASYPLDAPAQLIEFTFDSNNLSQRVPSRTTPKNESLRVYDPKTKQLSQDPDDGVPMTDIDLSYVDQLYLPVAVALDDNGVSKYLGTTLSYDEFTHRLNKFIETSKWSSFAAYSKQNWKNNTFNTLVNQSFNVPANYNLISLVNTKALSQLYTAPSPTYRECSAFTMCKGLIGNCCPNDKGEFLACCGLENYMIDNTSVLDNKMVNPTVNMILLRWKKWISDENPCDEKNITHITSWPSHSPTFDKKAFCNAFRETVKFVWSTFRHTAKNCGIDVNDEQCILQHIVGYNSEEVSGKIPESVQALLRSVPYGNKDKGLAYHYDKWLLFSAPFDSIFNLNPYSRLIHNDREGIDAVAYSFSIDDKYGNYRGEARGFIVDAGGNSKLLNKEAYDPYEQYFINWGPGWNHAEVCGRNVNINHLPGNARISMWKDGKKNAYCDITLYTDNQQFVKFRVSETTALVTDNYTGINGYKVYGLKHTDENYCKTNSSDALIPVCSTSYFAAVLDGDIAYVSLSDNEKPKVNLNVPTAPTLH